MHKDDATTLLKRLDVHFELSIFSFATVELLDFGR